jgi:hypothetical protein
MVLNLFPQVFTEEMTMLGPLIETNRHQSLPNSANGSQINPSSCRYSISKNTSKFREEESIAAQLDGLPDRIAQLESIRE